MKWYQNIWNPKRLSIVFIRYEAEHPVFTAINAGKEIKNEGRFESFEDVVAHCGTSAALHLHISGSGVLSRKTESLPNFREQLIISGNPDEFYFTSFDDGYSIAVSFFRKQLTASIEELCKERNLHLLGISSGSIPALTLLEDESIQLDYTLKVQDGRIETFERNQHLSDKVLFKGERLTPEEIIAVSLQTIYTEPDERYTHTEYTETAENYKNFRQFKTFGLSALSIIFLSLAINYFYQNNLNNEVAQLEQELSLSNDNLALLDRLDQEKMRKEQLISSAGVTSPRFLAFYLDDIGSSVPATVHLQEMKLFPLEGKLKNKQKITVDQSKITLIGTVPDNMTLDDWIEKMDRNEWVRSIELLNYVKVNEKQAEFKLLINIAV